MQAGSTLNPSGTWPRKRTNHDGVPGTILYLADVNKQPEAAAPARRSVAPPGTTLETPPLAKLQQ